MTTRRHALASRCSKLKMYALLFISIFTFSRFFVVQPWSCYFKLLYNFFLEKRGAITFSKARYTVYSKNEKIFIFPTSSANFGKTAHQVARYTLLRGCKPILIFSFLTCKLHHASIFHSNYTHTTAWNDRKNESIDIWDKKFSIVFGFGESPSAFFFNSKF